MIHSVTFAQVAVAGKCPPGMEGSPFGEFFPAECVDLAVEETTARLMQVPGVVLVQREDADPTVIFMTGFDESGAAVDGYGVMITLVE